MRKGVLYAKTLLMCERGLAQADQVPSVSVVMEAWHRCHLPGACIDGEEWGGQAAAQHPHVVST